MTVIKKSSLENGLNVFEIEIGNTVIEVVPKSDYKKLEAEIERLNKKCDEDYKQGCYDGYEKAVQSVIAIKSNKDE